MQQDKVFLAQKIRTQYTEKEVTALDDLKALDEKVKRAPSVFAYVFGTLGALVMGTGMSFAMGVIGTSMPLGVPLGIAVGVIGMLMVAINYPFYKGFLGARRKKYAQEIIAMSDKILAGEQ